jgi:hypothetical protein
MSSIIAKPLPAAVASMTRFFAVARWRNEPLPLASDCHRFCGTQPAVPVLHFINPLYWDAARVRCSYIEQQYY